MRTGAGGLDHHRRIPDHRKAGVSQPEVLIVTSPHQIMYADYFHIPPGRGATGDMSAFGAAQTRLASVDRNISLHQSRFFPRYQIMDKPSTPVKRVYHLSDVAREYLSYVYKG